MTSSYVNKLKIFEIFCQLYGAFFKRSFESPRIRCCYRVTTSNVYTVKKMCSRWYRSQFNKIEKAWVRVEILCLDFLKTWSDQYIKSRKVATFENCEIFSDWYFYTYGTINPPSRAASKGKLLHVTILRSSILVTFKMASRWQKKILSFLKKVPAKKVFWYKIYFKIYFFCIVSFYHVKKVTFQPYF